MSLMNKLIPLYAISVVSSILMFRNINASTEPFFMKLNRSAHIELMAVSIPIVNLVVPLMLYGIGSPWWDSIGAVILNTRVQQQNNQ